MFYPAVSVFNQERQENGNSENKLELLFSKGEATLFANGEQLMYFRSPVQVAGQEVLDWMTKGLLTELVSLEDLAINRGITITAREMAPAYNEKRVRLAQSDRSLLLNPQWFSIYFIVISGHILRKPAAHNELYNSLDVFFETGKAIVDYENRNLYLRRLRNP